MMRVLTPNGNVIEVEKAEAIVEKRVSFNGRDIRLCQTAKDKSQPASGLYFSVKTESVFTIANEGNLLVGNLPVDTVKKIVTNLAKDGSESTTSLYLTKANRVRIFAGAMLR